MGSSGKRTLDRVAERDIATVDSRSLIALFVVIFHLLSPICLAAHAALKFNRSPTRGRRYERDADYLFFSSTATFDAKRRSNSISH